MAMSVGQGDEGEASSIADINTTPLVDIMLVLLIIFLITVPVIKKTVVTIPKADNIPTQTKPENITIQVDKEGKIYWNGGRIDDLINALVQVVLNIPVLFLLITLSVLVVISGCVGSCFGGPSMSLLDSPDEELLGFLSMGIWMAQQSLAFLTGVTVVVLLLLTASDRYFRPRL